MPSSTPKFAILDTSVYIENFRTGRFAFRILQSPFVVRCSAVVLHELLRGAQSKLERRFVMDLMERCQIFTPTEGHWLQAAETLSAMRKRETGCFDSGKILPRINTSRSAGAKVMERIAAASITKVFV